MLTGDLVRVKADGKRLFPRYVEPQDPRLLERAQVLCRMFAMALEEGWTRERIDEECREVEGVDTDHKLTKGLAKVLVDRGTFETVAPIDPFELRERLFRLAAQRGPLARQEGPAGRIVAHALMAEVASALGVGVESLARGLYADRKDQQVLVDLDLPTDEGLLHRYNVALVQALLLRSSFMQVWMHDVAPKELQALLRRLRFHELLFSLDGSGGTRVLRIDGPASVLRLSSRYGLQLASVFPAVLLLRCPWRVEAEVLWTKRNLKKELVIEPAQGLQSHYADRGTWRSRTEQWFTERFPERAEGWTMSRGEALDLGAQRVFLPDCTFRRAGRVAHLEFVGHWRRGTLTERLRELPANALLAVPKKLQVDDGSATEDPRVLLHGDALAPSKVVLALEALATPEKSG